MPLSWDVVAVAGALEMAVHGWDIAQACGRDLSIPAGLAERLLASCPLLVGAGDRHSRFAPAVPVPRSAGPGDRLVALLGRQPRPSRR
jgi:uncharacterized protein (TIGR03086 family)